MPDIDEDDSDETLTIRNCKFSYKCNKNWFELFDTKEKHIKFCSTCQHEVFYCRNDEELLEAIKINKCVCIETPYMKGHMLGMPDSEKIKKIR